MSTVLKSVTRPQLVRAGLATLVALAGVVVTGESGSPAGAGLIAKFRDEVEVGDIVALTGACVFVIAALYAVRALTRAADRMFEMEFGEQRAAPLGLIVGALGNIVVVLETLSILGLDLSGLLIGGAIGGIVIGIAAQQTFANIFAGFVLLGVRPFRVGEDIVLRSGPLGGEYRGRVHDIGLFYVDLVTEYGPVKLPNAGVLAGAVGPGARQPQETDEEEDAAPPSEGGAPGPEPK